MNKLVERVNGRVLAVILAVILAAIATLALSDYVQGEKEEAVGNRVLVSVYVNTQPLTVGQSVDDLVFREVFQLRERLSEEVPQGALSSLDVIAGNVVITPLPANTVLQAANFAPTVPVSEVFVVPEGMVAVSLDIGVTEGVANFVDPGDRVSIVTYISGADADGNPETIDTSGATSRIMLQNVEILAIGRRVSGVQTAEGKDTVARSDERLLITFAVTPADAERLIFAQFESTLYLLLQPGSDEDFTPVTTPGRNTGNLFGR